MTIKEIIKDINAVALSHTHGDHWDDVAAKNIPKSFQFLCKIIQIRIY